MKYLLIEFSNPSHTISVDVNYDNARLKLRYTMEPEPIVWPAFNLLTRQTGLWESTCFELFLGRTDDPGYLEVNLSPCGAWNCFSFSDSRCDMKESAALTPGEITTHAYSLTASLDCDPPLAQTTYTLGLAAVVKKPTGELSYFAHSHGDKPDFHDRSRHVLVKPDNL